MIERAGGGGGPLTPLLPPPDELGLSPPDDESGFDEAAAGAAPCWAESRASPGAPLPCCVMMGPQLAEEVGVSAAKVTESFFLCLDFFTPVDSLALQPGADGAEAEEQAGKR